MKNPALKYFNKNKNKQQKQLSKQPLEQPSGTSKQKPIQKQYTSLINFQKALNWLKSQVLKTKQSKRKIEYLEQIQEIKKEMRH